MKLWAAIRSAIAAPFALVGRAFCFAINLNSDQLRALCVWAMCGGIAVLGFTNIWHTVMVDHAVERGTGHKALVEIATESIRYNTGLQFIMVVGVVLIAAQLTSFKAKLGELANIETTVKQAVKEKMPDGPVDQ